MTSQLLGQTLGNRYQFDELLGEGSFAHVYRITDLHRRAPLAAKVLRPDIAHEEEFLARFQREAIVLSRLQHPHIVRFYEIVEIDPHVFILMDYIPGVTLEALFNGQPMSPRESLQYLTPLASALQFAHNEGIIHRDLKPANILLHQNGTLYVTDFGIARILNTTSELTQGTTIGTPFYMAPEQITGEPVTVATDVYALGILLYRLYTGQLPFRGETGVGDTPGTRIVHEHVHTTPEDPTRVNSTLSPAIAEVVMRCLAKNAVQRYASVGAVYDALAEATGAPPANLGPAPQESGAPPGMKPPEWSQFMAQVPSDAAPSTGAAQVVQPAPPADPAKRETAEHDWVQPDTEPHLEQQLDAARTLPAMQRQPRQAPATQPRQAPVIAPPPPSPPLAPATYEYEAHPRRNWSTWGMALGALLVVLTLCIAAVYLYTSFNENDDDNTIAPVPTATSDLTATGTQNTSVRGTRVAFDSQRYGSLDIFVIDQDGTGLEPLTSDPGAERGPAWSPDGSQIAYYAGASEDGIYDIFVMNADGTNPRNLTQTASADERYPTWSPDGQRLAFHSNADGDWELYVINIDGSGLQQLTNNGADDLGPDWSPEGTQIAYHTNVWGEPFEIALLDLNTNTIRRLTANGNINTFPTWSPDGTQIAFNAISTPNGTIDLYLILPDGSPPNQVTTSEERDAFPDWARDGTHLIYQHGEPEVSEIRILDLSTGAIQTITGRQGNFLPEWEPAP